MKKERALIIEEKKFRVTNYVTSLHEGLFNIAAAVGVSSLLKLAKNILL